MRFTKSEILKTLLMALIVGATLWETAPAFTQGTFGGGKGFRGFGGFGRGGFGRGMRGMSGYNNMRGRNRIVDVNTDLDELLDPNTTLKPYATLNGIVYGEDGKPAADITVTISRQDAKGEYKINSKKDGKFTYDGLPAGEYTLGVIYNIKTKTSKDGDAGLLRDATLKNGRIVQSDFDLKEFVSMGKPGSFDELKNRLSQQKDPEPDSRMSLEVLELYDKARDAYEKGDYATAVAILKDLVQREPKESVLWNRLGEAYMALVKFDEASTAFRKAVELKPEVASYNGNLAISLLFLDKVDEAIVYTEKTAELSEPRGAAAYYNLGLKLTDMGETKKAEAAFEKSTKLDSSSVNADSFFELGLTLLTTHNVAPYKITDAIVPLQEFQKLVSDDPLRKENAQVAKELIAEISKPATTGTSNKAAPAPANNNKAPAGSKK
jgi:tetratricopeptide (TPR) repeat protein